MNKAQVQTRAAASQPASQPARRPLEAWRRFKQHPLSLLGLAIILLLVVAGATAPYLTPYEPGAFNLMNSLKEPSLQHWLGTDHLGRDVLTRLLYGSRLSLTIGVLATVLGFTVGVPLGALSGYLGGWVDLFIQRVVDMMFAFPGIILAIFLASLLGPGLWNVVTAIGIGTVPLFIRLMRGSVLSLREQPYIEAAGSLGARRLYILFRHVIPNALGPVTVQAALTMAITIPGAAGLGFLGLGVPPSLPEWGAMLGEARQYLFSAPHIAIAPGIAIFLTTMAFNFLGDGLRDAADPVARRGLGER